MGRANLCQVLVDTGPRLEGTVLEADVANILRPAEAGIHGQYKRRLSFVLQ